MTEVWISPVIAIGDRIDRVAVRELETEVFFAQPRFVRRGVRLVAERSLVVSNVLDQEECSS